MAYYDKEGLKIFINEEIKKIDNLIKTEGESSVKLMSQPRQFMETLDDESEIVGFFWLQLNNNGQAITPIMQGKTFVRIEGNLYTDDSYAIDSFQSSRDGIPVAAIIKKRLSNKP